MHADSCIIASSGLSLCDENIQGLEGLEVLEGQRESREGGWQKRGKETGKDNERMRNNLIRRQRKTRDRARNNK